jgi:hypothetical protein
VRRLNRLILPALLFALSQAAFAQMPLPFYTSRGIYARGAYRGAASLRVPPPPIQLMEGAPYSGQWEDVRSFISSSGIRTTSRRGLRVFRDAQGRIRSEAYLGGGPKPERGVPTLVEIQDPVAGFICIMDDVNRVAHRIKTSVTPQPNMEQLTTRDVPAMVAAARAVSRSEAAPAPQESLEDLGAQLMNGALVHGTRMVRALRGAAGNGLPLTDTRDIWYAPDLNLIVSVVMSAPTGTTVQRLADLRRGPPDPSLFLVPPNYRIVDESGSFEITWGK